MDPRTANMLITELSKNIERNPEVAAQPILLTSPTIRRHLFKLTSRFLPQLVILSHNELTADAHVSSVGTVGLAYAS
jgi:flagellar biosynthesis protein FlhA